MPPTGDNQTIGMLFDTGEEFEDLLDQAEDKAVTKWEMDFCDGVRRRWEQYGMRSFMSESQFQQLKTIAEK